LTQAGFYDGTRIHRIVPNLLVQGGDPLSKNTDLVSIWGKGGPGYVIADEIGPDEKLVRGTVAMANQGPHTTGSQFFIVTADSIEWLEGQHTIIGQVTAGMEVIENISSTQISILGIPQEEIVVEKIVLR
jgi:cyclophilin family peptidyl-prolyl cis-trans isomerase